LEIALVWVRKGKWASLFVLDDQPTNGITAFLTAPGTITGNPYRLKANEDKSFIGSYVLGMGFVLTPEEAQRLVEKDASNKDVLFPYLNGEDLNSRPDQSPSRWVISFFDWPIEKAKEYPDCFHIVEEKVKPERMALRDTADGKRLKQRWWLFGRERPELHRAIAGMERVLVCPIVTKYVSFVFAPSGIVYMHKLCVFPFRTSEGFALLTSNFHEPWVREYCSTLETRLNYSPADCFDTFPFPANLNNLAGIGTAYYDHRRQIMLARKEGLTKTYNRFHDPEETSADIQELRQLHVKMDQAVAAAYGWSDLVLGHDFGVTKQGLRYTISELARREILARLLALNHERYAEEVKQGLHDPKAKKTAGKRKRRTTKTAQPVLAGASLYDTVLDTAFPSTSRDKFLCGLLCDLVAAHPGLPPTAYLDAMVIALRYKRHGSLLIGNERKQFAKLAGLLPQACVQSADKIPWMELLELLSQQEAIRKDAGNLQPGSQFGEVRKARPTCDSKLIQLIHKAAATLRELQSSAKPDTEQELPTFKEDLESLYGGTP
jgi:hypothetical protein